MILQANTLLMAIVEQTTPEKWVSSTKPFRYREDKLVTEAQLLKVGIKQVVKRTNSFEGVITQSDILSMKLKSIQQYTKAEPEFVTTNTTLMQMGVKKIRTNTELIKESGVANTYGILSMALSDATINRGFNNLDLDKDTLEFQVNLLGIGIKQVFHIN